MGRRCRGSHINIGTCVGSTSTHLRRGTGPTTGFLCAVGAREGPWLLWGLLALRLPR